MTDADLRSLFGEPELHIDPQGPAAQALLDEILVPEAPVVPSDTVIDLKDIEPAAISGRSKLLILAGAAAAVIALVAGAIAFRTDDTPVTTDDVETPDPENSVGVIDLGDLEPILGPQNPLVAIIAPSSAPDSDESLGCMQRLWGRFVLADTFMPLLMTGTRFDAANGAPEALRLSGAGFTMTCRSVDDFTYAPALTFLDLKGAPLRLHGAATSTSQGGEQVFEIDGYNAVDVEAVDLLVEEIEAQTFQENGGFFRIVGTASEDIFRKYPERLVFRVTRLDGSVEDIMGRELRWPDLCRDSECLAEEVAATAAAARSAGRETQAAALDDGALTQTEFDAAVDRYIDCLSEGGLTTSGVPTAILETGSADAEAALACHESTIRYVELARHLINRASGRTHEGTIEDEAGEESVEDSDFEPEDLGLPTEREVFSSMWRAEAQQLFQGGLGPNEIRSRNTGVYVDEAAIEAFASDFAWTFEDRLTIETYEYYAFPDTSDEYAFTPIVTLISQDDPKKSASFVMHYTLETFRLEVQRLPTLEEPEPLVETAEDGTTTLTFDVVGAEGSPQGFVAGQTIPTEVDFETLTTTVTLGPERTGSNAVTLVVPTPEAPAAISTQITLDKDFAEPQSDDGTTDPDDRSDSLLAPLIGRRAPLVLVVDEREAFDPAFFWRCVAPDPSLSASLATGVPPVMEASGSPPGSVEMTGIGYEVTCGSEVSTIGPVPPASRCGDDSCVIDQLQSLSADPASQPSPLADGILSQEEYDAALDRFEACVDIAALGQSGVRTALVEIGSFEHRRVTECFDEHLRTAELARAIVNAVADLSAEDVIRAEAERREAQ